MEGMPTSQAPSVDRALKGSAALDARFHRLRGDRGDEAVTDKDRAFRALFGILEAGLDREDGGRFDDLLIRAVAHYALAAAG